mgnify:FL=1
MLGAFLTHYQGRAPDTVTLSTKLASVLFECKQTHPTLVIDTESFAKTLATRVAIESDPTAALDSLAVCDVFLCVATLAGNAAALVTFEFDVQVAIKRLGARFRLSADQADERKQELLERLLLPVGDREPRLTEYAGKGSLVRWLQAVATRLQLNVMRGKKREVLVNDEAMLEALAEPICTAIEPGKDRFRGALKIAFSTALANLAAEDKLLLRMAYVEGVRLEGLGRALGISRATAHRRLTKAREALAKGVEQSMSEELSIPIEKLSSVRRLVQSQVSVSIGRLLS